MYKNVKRFNLLSFVIIGFLFMDALLVIGCLSGCKTDKEPKDKLAVDFTVVSDVDMPEELLRIINSKKDKAMRLTYTTKDYTYVVAGYGTKDTSGYSIKVNNVYTGNDSLYVDLSLLGPAEDEEVGEVSTYPYIVLRMERRDETVIFKM